MDADINFTLAILRKVYAKRREQLLELELSKKEKEITLTDLELIKSAMVKIKCKFSKNKECSVRQ